ncbi:MAG TPA: EAL domain-containing protein [Abditibacteriaceae bacterium]
MLETPIRVLLIEDDENDYVVTRDLLNEAGLPGLTLDRVATYHAAIEALRRREHDIYLLDCELNGHSCLDILREVNDADLASRAILLTRQHDPKISETAFDTGVADYLFKDHIDAQSLARAIRYALGRARARREQERIVSENSELAQAIETLDVGVTIIDAGDTQRRITFANPAFLRLVGRGRDEAVAHDIRFLFGAETDAPEVRKFEEALKNSCTFSGEILCYRKDGTSFWNSLTVSPVRDASGQSTGCVVLHTDVTAHHEAQKALAESERRLSTIIQDAPLIICSLDSEGRLTFAAGKSLEKLGHTSDELLGQSIFDLYADRPEIVASVRRVLSGEEIALRQQEGSIVFDTRYLPVRDDSGRVIGATGVATDVTAQWQALEKINFQATILDAVGQAAIATDLDGKIVYMNYFAEKLYGWPACEAIGQNIYTVTTPQIMQHQAEEIMACLARGEGWSGEFLVQRRDGTTFPAWISNSPVYNNQCELTGIVGISHDITQRKQSERALRESEERYALAAAAANDGLWDWDLVHDSLYYSTRWKAMLGFEDELLDNSPEEWLSRVNPDETERVRSEIRLHLDGETDHFESEYRILHADGNYRWMLSRGLAMRDAEGRAYRIVGSQTDITERKTAEEQLLQNAFFDTLTGLPNRALFNDRLERMFASTGRRKDYHFALLFLDLDRFKVVNDSLGHLLGDQFLIEVTRRLEKCVRSNDTFARLGGDEFAILVDDVKDIDEATQLAERLHLEMVQPFSVEGHEIFTTVSVGIVLNDGSYERASDLLRDADIAMYHAKATGKAHHEIFNHTMHAQAISQLKLEADMRRAIERQEWELHYQPIVSLKTGHLAGFEALVRWRHPEHGLVSPAEFIPLAEESGYIVPLGQWVLGEACRQMRDWQQKYHIPGEEVQPNNGVSTHTGPITMSVNISSRQFSQPHLVEQVRAVLHESGLDARCLHLEITESVIMENAESAAVMLGQLKKLGVQISIDDFGTGYSSLSSLYQFPLDTLKVDRSFVNRLGENGENSEIVRTIIALALNLNMKVVAEGVESSSHLAQLAGLQCDFGQGFLFAKPLLAAEAESLLRAGPRWWESRNGTQPGPVNTLVNMAGTSAGPAVKN